MGPSIFIVRIIHGRVCEQCYGLVKVFIEYCHELTLSYGNKLFLKNTPVVCEHSFPVYSLAIGGTVSLTSTGLLETFGPSHSGGWPCDLCSGSALMK